MRAQRHRPRTSWWDLQSREEGDPTTFGLLLVRFEIQRTQSTGRVRGNHHRSVSGKESSVNTPSSGHVIDQLDNPSRSSKVIQSSVAHGPSTGFDFARVLRSVSVHSWAVNIIASDTWICSGKVEAPTFTLLITSKRLQPGFWVPMEFFDTKAKATSCSAHEALLDGLRHLHLHHVRLVIGNRVRSMK